MKHLKYFAAGLLACSLLAAVLLGIYYLIMEAPWIIGGVAGILVVYAIGRSTLER